MASFGKHFAYNQSLGKSDPKTIKKGNTYRITVLTDRLVRLEYSKEGVFNDNLTDLVKNRKFEPVSFNAEEDSKYLVITTKYFSLQYLKESPFKGPSFAPDANLKVKLLNTDKVWYYDHPEARNFKATSFSLDNFDGRKKKMGKGLYSTDGFATIDDSKTLIIDEIGILTSSNEENIDIYLFMYKRDFGLCLKDYFTLTGYPPMIPRYALGVWWFRDRIYSHDDAKLLVKTFKEYEIPLNVLLLGEFWHDKDELNINLKKSGYTFNKNLFPNPNAFVEDMHKENVYVGINMDPTEGITKQDECYEDFKKQLTYIDDANIPFKAFDKMYMILYFENIINSLMTTNIDFFWMDYKKDINSLRVLNHYHIRDFAKNESKRPMLLTRNTSVASHNNGVLYSGETIVSWNTLKYLPFYNASASNLGLSWWSHDVGGYKSGTEDSELYMRYVQFSTFSPIFRFSAKRGIYYKREPWTWDFKTYNIVKEYIQLRQRLIPYIYSEAFTYHDSGLPLIQPLYYANPELVDSLEYQNEYYFGSNLLVCPITTPKDKVMERSIQRVYLPKGVWYDFKTGKKYFKNNKYILFYKDEDYPVFAKAGAIIPMARIKDKLNMIENPVNMDIHVFPGKSNSYLLYEDDGISKLYESGYYVKTSIDYNYMQNNFSLIIHPVEGKTHIIPEKRNYQIYFRNTKQAERVEVFVNNARITDNRVSYEEKGNDFVVTVKNIDTTRQLTINCTGKDIERDSSRLVNEDINSIIVDLQIPTDLKEQLARICFSSMEIKNKRIEIRKLARKGLDLRFIKMFMKLYDYLAEI